MPIYSAQVTDLENIGPIVDIQILPTAAAAAAIVKSGGTPPLPQKVSALIDTGASGSVIQESIAADLGLTPIGQQRINTPSCQDHPCYTYAVMLLLPKPVAGIEFSIRFETTIIAAPLAGQNIQCLLGRDFLKHVLMIYNGPQDSFCFSL